MERVNLNVFRLRLPDSYPGNPEEEVEKILGHKRVGKSRTLKFLARWAGYGPQFDQWLTARDLTNSPDLLWEYRKKEGL
ncbi:hypothetical protein GALMADRAFT_76047 [Galerina marginata CBS 339.88]|uniref:Chromo domain-containing protein n=1 Tax=Galerina marginata (strain CBS 339.88) TaxID=685588 RepID=A0A067SSD8_GALM3|nr:hypothetical protein GALMADRAFT_76047 [Galerina marginata CBS 339.88]